MRTVVVRNASRPGALGDRIVVAQTAMRRLVGLLGQRGLDHGRGLWIKPSSGVHTMGMLFPIDVIGLDQDLVVVKLWRCLRPFRLTSVSLKVRSVLELPAGTIDASGTQVGDRLHVPARSVEEST